MSSRKKLDGSVYGSIRVTLEVSFDQPWSTGATIDEIILRAQRDGEETIMKMIQESNSHGRKIRLLKIDSDVTLRFKEKG